MTITLTLPVLVSVVLVAMLAGVGFAVLALWLVRVEARLRQLEGLMRDWVHPPRYPGSTEMAVAE